jgi:hypothetical protein
MPSMTKERATDANLDLNLASGWGMKQVVDFFKASLEEITIIEAC